MNLALSYTASATDASDTLISAPDATRMSLDTCFQNRFRSVLMGKALGFLPESGRGMHVLAFKVDNTQPFIAPVSQKEHGKHSQNLGLVSKFRETNQNPTPNNNQYS